MSKSCLYNHAPLLKEAAVQKRDAAAASTAAKKAAFAAKKLLIAAKKLEQIRAGEIEAAARATATANVI